MAGILKNDYNRALVFQGAVQIGNELQNEQRKVPAMPDEEAPETPHISAAELEQLREQYINEGRAILQEARAQAEEIVNTTRQKATEVFTDANEQAHKMQQDAIKMGYAEGFEKGHSEGDQKGYDEGFRKGLEKCKDTLLELKSLIEQAQTEKSDLFKGYENEIFDTVFEISQKITVGSLKQKDKGVITKLIKEAGKDFRNAEYIKVTLCELDVSEEFAADNEFFKSVFRNAKTIDVEVLKDADEGTVIIDNGSEITDASISTQLKMIKELGKGKYRDKPNSRTKKTQAEDDTEAPQQTQPEEIS